MTKIQVIIINYHNLALVSRLVSYVVTTTLINFRKNMFKLFFQLVNLHDKKNYLKTRENIATKSVLTFYFKETINRPKFFNTS